MRSFKLLIIFIAVLLSCANKVTQDKEISEEDMTHQSELYENVATVLLDIDFTGEIYVYDKPDGKIIKTLKNNIEETNFVMLDLLQKNDSMFYVIAHNSLEEDTITRGWIMKSHHLGIYSRMYTPEIDPLILYENPNDTLQIVVKDTVYNPKMYEVVDFEGKWLKVKTKINGKNYEGWLSPEMQCSNVYSTCS